MCFSWPESLHIPDTTHDGKPVAEVIPAEFREPLLVYSLESEIVFYNFGTFPKGYPFYTL